MATELPIGSTALLSYSLPMIGIWTAHAYRRVRRNRLAVERRTRARISGLEEPVSLHPLIADDRCLGCGACVHACPEGDVLGLLKGKAHLLTAGNCIGHGACATACPTDAITLVFGTATRGVQIPRIGPDFQSNVPGVYIAGELGGMGLIRNAVTQGCQAVDGIAAACFSGANDESAPLDLVIVGAGPAGLAASLAAKKKGLRFTTIEQDALGGAIAHYPRGKIVMTTPVDLPLVGRLPSKVLTKEELIAFWQHAEQKAELQIHYGERFDSIATDALSGGLLVHTSKTTYATRNVILAIGRRGTPRKLGVAGEAQPKVVYRLIDAQQYRGRRVLVVGGGDSAVEAAIALAQQPRTSITLCYRGTGFSKAKAANRDRLEHATRDRDLTVLLQSTVREILQSSVTLDTPHGPSTFANDNVIVCAGGTVPTELLQRIGIRVDTKYGTA